MERLKKIFEKELVESWSGELPDYAKRVLELLEKKDVAQYEEIGHLKWYNSSYEEREDAKDKRDMEVYFNKKENKLYGSVVYNSVTTEMIIIDSINCQNGIADTNGRIIKIASTGKCCGYNASFMKDFCCTKKEGIPYRIYKKIETYTIYELKKEGGKGEFIAKEYNYDDAIRIMKNAAKESYIVYVNGMPNVFYKEDLI